MKNVNGLPSGNDTPGSAGRSGSPGPSPAAMLSLEPCISSRTSWPRALYRVLETTAIAPPSKVSTAEAVWTSPSSPNHSASWFVPAAYTSVTSCPVTHRTASKSCTAQSRKIPPEAAR
jgi:hypothetical protein